MPSGTTRDLRVGSLREASAIDTSYEVGRSDWMIVCVAIGYLIVTVIVMHARSGAIFFMFVVIAATVLLAGIRRIVQIRYSVMLILIFLTAFFTAQRSISELNNVELGEYSGVATVKTDPRTTGAATHVVIEINGDRFVIYAYGRPGWRLAGVKVGEQVFVDGIREEVAPDKKQRLMAQHIKGKFQITNIAEVRLPAAPMYRSAQKIRDLVRSGADSFEYANRELFTGLVIGDDTRQSSAMIKSFRDSGLAHLVAVSGQNVAFILAGLSPLLAKLNRRSRIIITLIVLSWFVVITRVEPSVVRAAIMAGLGYVSVAIGRPTRTLRLIALTVLIAVVVDPLLALSVGFYMSVGATCGLCLGAQKFAKMIPGPKWFAQLVGASIAAQLGVMPAVIFVFGLPPATGIIANIFAVPVAGVVMLFGLPLAIFSGLISEFGLSSIAQFIMFPVELAVRWVSWVAETFAHLKVHGVANFALWLVIISAILMMRHRSARV